jgi:hypothetical protein
MWEEGKGREAPGRGESADIMIPYAPEFADTALAAIARLQEKKGEDEEEEEDEELTDEERRNLLTIFVQYAKVNGGFSGALDVLKVQPAEHLLIVLTELTEVQPGLFRGGDPESMDELADRFLELMVLIIDEEWKGELYNPEDFVTMSGVAGPWEGDVLRAILKLLRSWPREEGSLYWRVIGKLSACEPPNCILSTLILSGDEGVLEVVRGDAGQAWKMVVEAELYLDAREWREFVFLVAPSLGSELMGTSGETFGLPFPCEFLRAEAVACGDDRGLGDICRVLSQICRTADEAQAAWTAFGMGAEQLLAIYIDAPYALREGIAAFCSAIAKSGADLPLPPELCGEEAEDEVAPV